jgi:AcrR family transcriptional regulator
MTLIQPAAGSGDGPPPPRTRPLRRDAERNRQRILRAAAEVFTEHGLAATLDDVARRAGVGIGTVYRRFPDKEALVDALFEERLGALVALGEQALRRAGEWDALEWFLDQAGALLATDRGLQQILMFTTYGRNRTGEARASLKPLVSQLVGRAQAAGVVRGDLSPTDIPMIEFMLATVAGYADPARPGVWRRYLALILDGLRPERAGTTALPEPALSPDEMQAAMAASGAGRP